MNTIRLTSLVSIVALLAGCVAVPVESGPPGYYAPPSVYYGPPVFYGPSIEFGIFGGHGHWHHHH